MQLAESMSQSVGLQMNVNVHLPKKELDSHVHCPIRAKKKMRLPTKSITQPSESKAPSSAALVAQVQYAAINPQSDHQHLRKLFDSFFVSAPD